MEAAAPAAAEAAGREELGGCRVREGARADVARGCASAGFPEAPGLRLAWGTRASAGAPAAAAAPAPRGGSGLMRVQVSCL